MLDAVIAQIDAANAQDPRQPAGQPLALVQGRRATHWLDQLCDSPGPEVQVSVRAHHLRRWEIVRADYPAGRQGYLRWRRDNKAHQGASLAAILTEAGWPTESIERSRTILARTKLRSDPDTQLLEDAACLVFLETQFDEMLSRTDVDHLVSIVAKTLPKMSADAVRLASSLELSDAAAAVLGEAVTEWQRSSDHQPGGCD